MKRFWYCDLCGKIIENPRQGIVEWLTVSTNGNSYGLHLVHRVSSDTPQRCQYEPKSIFRDLNATISSIPMTKFLGPDGLQEFLSILASDRLPKLEVLVMIKRFHVPGYEVVRPHIIKASALGVISSSQDILHQKDIQLIINFLEKKGQTIKIPSLFNRHIGEIVESIDTLRKEVCENESKSS